LLKVTKPFPVHVHLAMQRQPFDEVAGSPVPGAASALGRELQDVASNDFRKPPDCFIGIHLAIVIQEQFVIY